MHEFGKFSDLGINWHFCTTITAVLSEVVKYVKYGKKIVSFFLLVFNTKIQLSLLFNNQLQNDVITIDMKSTGIYLLSCWSFKPTQSFSFYTNKQDQFWP